MLLEAADEVGSSPSTVGQAVLCYKPLSEWWPFSSPKNFGPRLAGPSRPNCELFAGKSL